MLSGYNGGRLFVVSILDREAGAPLNPRLDSDGNAEAEVDARDVGGSPADYPFQLLHLLCTFLGTSFAGAVYPTVIGGTVILYLGFLEVFQSEFGNGHMDSPLRLFGQALELMGAAFFFGGMGFMIAVIGAVFVMPAIYVIARTLELRCAPSWLGAIMGGTTGFATTAFFLGIENPSSGMPESLFFLIIGPGLATILGQIGGACGAWWADRIDRQIEAAQGAMINAMECAANAREPRRFQFGIRQILWLLTWLAILMTAIRLIGIPLPIAAATLAVGAVYQALTLSLGYFVVLPLLAKSRLRLARGHTA